MTLTLEQKKVKAEELIALRKEIQGTQMHTHGVFKDPYDYLSSVIENPIEQWFLEAVEEIEKAKKLCEKRLFVSS